MHMADALISTAVGATMWGTSAGIAAYSIKKNKEEFDEKKVPLMGVMGAFVFASQMVNFTIPGTGSSGHIGGGILLAILLGPEAGFLAMASILAIQALFFGDGGLLALGCNIFNLGFYTCFVGYPLFKFITKGEFSKKKIWIGSILSVIVALQLGAFSVVLETLLSGKTELPFFNFVLLMQPIHLAIGIVEGILTAAVVSFVYDVRPEVLIKEEKNNFNKFSFKKLIVTLSIVTIIIGGGVSLLASSNPDGLEWSIFNITQSEELEANGKTHEVLAGVQEKTAVLPDYGFKGTDEESSSLVVNGGTAFAGVIGSIVTLFICALIGIVVKRVKKDNINQAAVR